MSGITSEVLTIARLFGQGRFHIPWHQRNYDWDRDQVEELLVDIGDAAAEKRSCYFLGSLLLVRKPKSQWEINDGQQRMITLSLIANWLVRNHYERKNRDTTDKLMHMLFEGYESSTKGTDLLQVFNKPRIATPEEYRQSYEMLLREGSFGLSGKLKTACDVIAEYFETHKKSVCQFATYLLNKIEVSCIYIPRHINPNSIFESINCRGRRLDDVDLIRNYLYSFFNSHSIEKEDVHERLEKLVVLLGSNKRIAEYFECFFQCKYGYLQHNLFYRGIKKAIESGETAQSRQQTKRNVHSLISELTEDRNILFFIALRRADADESIAELSTQLVKLTSDKNARPLVSLLTEMKKYKVSYSVSFALLTRLLQKGAGAKTCRHVYRKLIAFNSFLMRSSFSVTTLSPSLYAEKFADLACEIYQSKDSSNIDIMERLSKCHNANIVMDDARFLESMKIASINSREKAKLLLVGIYSNGVNFKTEGMDLEHILPQDEKTWGRWPEFSRNEIPQYCNRIGNLALINRGEFNAGNKNSSMSYKDKRAQYATSSYPLTKEISKLAMKWTPAAIEKRQMKLIRRMVKIWPL